MRLNHLKPKTHEGMGGSVDSIAPASSIVLDAADGQCQGLPARIKNPSQGRDQGVNHIESGSPKTSQVCKVADISFLKKVFYYSHSRMKTILHNRGDIANA